MSESQDHDTSALPPRLALDPDRPAPCGRDPRPTSTALNDAAARNAIQTDAIATAALLFVGSLERDFFTQMQATAALPADTVHTLDALELLTLSVEIWRPGLIQFDRPAYSLTEAAA